MKLKLSLMTTALIALALPCAAQTIDHSMVASQTLPAAGTADEANVCATETTIVALAMSKTDGIEKETQDTFYGVMNHWVSKAAKYKGISAEDLMGSEAFVTMVASVMDIDMDTHVAMASKCIDRL